MSVFLQAPHPLIQTTTRLPNPNMEDTRNHEVVLTYGEAMDGTLYSYIHKSGNERLSYDFVLTREKSLELIAFIEVYAGYHMRLINHLDEVWYVWLINDPSEFSSIQVGEHNSVNLTFEGKKISG